MFRRFLSSASSDAFHSTRVDRRVRSVARHYGIFDDVVPCFTPSFAMEVSFGQGSSASSPSSVRYGNRLDDTVLSSKPSAVSLHGDCDVVLALDAGPATLGKSFSYASAGDVVNASPMLKRIIKAGGIHYSAHVASTVFNASLEKSKLLEEGKHLRLLWGVLANDSKDEFAEYQALKVVPASLETRRVVFAAFKGKHETAQKPQLSKLKEFAQTMRSQEKFDVPAFTSAFALEPVSIAFSLVSASKDAEKEAIDEFARQIHESQLASKPQSGGKRLRWIDA
ncbi:putative mitochondrial protein [Andalucia godoyi]|uniref:Putative mitochondrial protein n=1 Tax=Andalucia godoyi TaxID=505711 RepID=A0A8K0AIC7_ANDGO|nr:putative mitochondrial protein [Andalucia godoyi]|eukprot:ANDGO_06036.mRNA.1 putative mitochondrial protein